MGNQKYFHELNQGEKFDIYNKRMSWGKIAKEYPQPPWCKHEHAVGGLFGCEDLWIGVVKSEKDCEDCDFYMRGKK